MLGVDEVRSAPVAVGTGTVRGAHGVLPNPAPAVVALLAAAARRPPASTSPIELTTPTGAALLAALATGFGPLPAMTIDAPSATAPAPATSTAARTSRRS